MSSLWPLTPTHPTNHPPQSVWASKYNDRAYVSTRKVGINFDDVRMAVLCQRVVPAQVRLTLRAARAGAPSPALCRGRPRQGWPRLAEAPGLPAVQVLSGRFACVASVCKCLAVLRRCCGGGLKTAAAFSPGPQYAFVIHTTNPTNGDEGEVYCELVRGLGEAIVSGTVPGTALTFVARKDDIDNPRVRGGGGAGPHRSGCVVFFGAAGPTHSSACQRFSARGACITGQSIAGSSAAGRLGTLCLLWPPPRRPHPLQVLLYPSKSEGMFVPDSLIFRSDSNGEDLEGYAGAGVWAGCTGCVYRGG